MGEDATLRRTTHGMVSGVDRGATFAWWGIPYATAPRFRAPAPPAAWRGVRACSAKGPVCPQPGLRRGDARQDEDCLNLNIFSPAGPAPAEGRPVLFWIHGGGFRTGRGATPMCDGSRLAERGRCVVVTINYRLGALGYLCLRHLPGAESTAVNAGQLDQIAALRWCATNAAAFGGDPGNVTIFGESAGGVAVGTLLAMPAAAGLFHKAVMQSGGGGTAAAAAGAGRRAADALLAALGLSAGGWKALLDLPARRLVKAQGSLPPGVNGGFAPWLDPLTYPATPQHAAAEGRAARVPIIIGTNRDEQKLFTGMRPGPRREITDAQLLKAVRSALALCRADWPGTGPSARRPPKIGEEEARGVIAAFRESRRGAGLPWRENYEIADAVQGEVWHRRVRGLAAAAAPHQPAFAYLFTHESPAKRGALGACHGLDIPFVFGTHDAYEGAGAFAGRGPEADRLSRDMMGAWLAFARTGDPSHPGIGEWPAYDAQKRATMVFGTGRSAAEDDPLSVERRVVAALTGAPSASAL